MCIYIYIYHMRLDHDTGLYSYHIPFKISQKAPFLAPIDGGFDLLADLRPPLPTCADCQWSIRRFPGDPETSKMVALYRVYNV